MTLSSGDQTKIRSAHQSWVGRRLLTVNAVPLTIVASAQIAQATFVYPLADINVDNVSADWLTEGLAGRLVMVGTAPGLHDITVGVLRANVTSGNLKIDPRYSGEPGSFPKDIQQLLADNLYVSIVKFRPPYGLMSSIRKSVFYKNWDTTFSTSARYPSPIVRLGPHQQADVNPSTGLARFTIDVDPYYWTGSSYSAHQWGLDGQTQISASASQLVVDCEPGCHEISYALTDSRGKVTIAYRYLFANDDTEYPPLNDLYPMDIDCTQDRRGCSFNVTLHSPLASADTVFPGQLWLMTTTPQWGSYTPDDLDDPEGVVTNFIGYVTEGGLRMARGVRETRVTLESPVKMAGHVPIEKQITIESKTPANWAEVTSTLSNPVGTFWYLSALHAGFLINGHDFYFDSFILSLRRQIHNLDSDVTLGGQLEQLSRYLDGEGNIGSDASGATWMLRHPAYFATSSRNALDTQWAWVVGDLDGELERPLRFRPTVGKTIGGAFSFNGTTQAARALAPGYVRSQAGGELTMDDTTVTAAGGQARINEIVGFHHARQNMRSAAFQFAVNGLMDVAEPCRLDRWHTFTLAAGYDPLGDGWTAARFIPLQVTRRWSGPGGRRFEVTVEAEPESFGYPGITLPQNPGAANMWGAIPAPAYFEPYREKTPDLELDIPVMTAWNNVFEHARSFNIGEPQTSWSYMRGDVLSADLDWHSDYFGDPADPLGLYVLTYDTAAEELILYYVPEIRDAALTFNELNTWSSSVLESDGFRSQARVICSREEADFLFVAWRIEAGIFIDRSTDAGANWEGQQFIGDNTADPSSIGFPVGIAVYDERQVVIAKDGTTDADGNFVYFVYTASTKGGSFTKINNPSGWSCLLSSIALRDASNALVPLYEPAAPEPDDPLETVTFEELDTPAEAGYPNWAITGNQGPPAGSNGPVEVGSDWRAYADFDSSTGGTGANELSVTVTVDLTAFYIFNSVTFDTSYVNILGSITGPYSSITVTALDAEANVIKQYIDDIEGAWPDDSPYTVTAADLGLTGQQIWYVRVSVMIGWSAIGSSTTATIYLDDIDIDADLVDYQTNRALHTLALGGPTYTQRDTFQLLPFHPYGIAVDSTSSSTVMLIARDEDGNQPYLLLSTNGGADWTKIRRVDGYVGLKRGGDIVIAFGYNKLSASNDGGVTGYNMLGNWSAVMRQVGRIEGVAGVL